MGTIICATRFGNASRTLQAKAIQTAKKSGDKLVFVYVIQPATLGDEADPGYQAAESEIRWFASALLDIAKRRGAREGVQVETVVRKGEVGEEIEKVVREFQASLLIMGQPAEENGHTSQFESGRLEEFKNSISNNTGATVQIFHPD